LFTRSQLTKPGNFFKGLPCFHLPFGVLIFYYSVQSVITTTSWCNKAITTKSQWYNLHQDEGIAIPKHACPVAEGCNPTAGLIWARNRFCGNSNYCQASEEQAGQTFPNDMLTECLARDHSQYRPVDSTALSTNFQEQPKPYRRSESFTE